MILISGSTLAWVPELLEAASSTTYVIRTEYRFRSHIRQTGEGAGVGRAGACSARGSDREITIISVSMDDFALASHRPNMVRPWRSFKSQHSSRHWLHRALDPTGASARGQRVAWPSSLESV